MSKVGTKEVLLAYASVRAHSVPERGHLASTALGYFVQRKGCVAEHHDHWLFEQRRGRRIDICPG